MKQISTLLLIGSLCLGGNAIAQSCNSPASSYDLIVVANTTIPPNASPNYMQGYVCNGGILLDSAICCTRFVNVDSGGTMIVGPNSYGMAYVMNGGTFNGQGASNNWQVYAEPNATVINHTGMNQACPSITFTASSCTMGFTHNDSPKPTVSLNGNSLNFGFNAIMNEVQIELLDVNGKVVKSEMMNQSSIHSMDVSGLASGVYMYRVMQGGEVKEVANGKILIQ